MKLNKDVTICFRTSAKVQTALREAAEHEQMSVSSLINNILNETLKVKIGNDKRRFNRKSANIPVIINGDTVAGKVLLTGTIHDVSLGGVKIAIPKHEQASLVISAEVKNFEIVFRLPDGSTRPVSMTCKPQRMQENGESIEVGAAFHDGDLQSYFEIQSFLM